MSWQTPKTDWTGADGVRNTDLNRIEGNILALYDEAMIRADLDVYVSTAGNDDIGTGSSASPYLTIAKALSTIPKNLSGKAVSIHLAAGTYTEDLTIRGFSGPIVITGGYNARVTVNNFTVDGCICVLDAYLVLNGRGAVVTNGGTLIGSGTMLISDASISLTATYGSRVGITAMVSNNATTYIMLVDNASHVSISNLSGSGNRAGLLIQGGSIVATGSTTSLGITGLIATTYSGGRYYTGSQNFSVNTLAEVEVI